MLRLIADPLLAIVLALPVHHDDRDKGADVFVQRHVIAEAIRAETKVRSERAMLLTIAHFESGLSIDVHRNECPRWACDVDRNGVHRARGLYQTWQNWLTDAEWNALIGLDLEATKRQTRYALRLIRGAYRLCRGETDWRRSTLSAYAGRGCSGTFKGLDERVAMARRIEARL